MHFVQKEKCGQIRLVRVRNLEKENAAYYPDRENWTFMTVRCVKESNATCEIVINGNIRIGNRSYDLRPAQGDDTSRNILQVPGVLGKRCILQDIANFRRKISVDNKDAENFDERRVQQERIACLRRLNGQGVVLSSQNIVALNKRGAPSDNNYSDRYDGEVCYDTQDSNPLSLQGQLDELVGKMAEFKVKLDRTERMEERLRKAEQGVEKLVRSLHLANVQLKQSEKRIEQLEKELKTARQDSVCSDKEDNQENENINITENGDHLRQKENESSINITKENGQANLKPKGHDFIIAPKNRRSAHDNVAFSVYWSNCGIGDIPLGDKETIPYDIVDLNDGNGFDTSIHAFICPLTGIYSFTNKVTTWAHKVETEIVLDGISKAALTTGTPYIGNLQSSQSALFRCRQHQRVWVRILKNLGVGMQCDVAWFTTFSGYLLWEDTESS